MSVNFSSSSNDSLLLSSSFWLDCLMSKPNSSIFTALTIINILVLLPLCMLILYHTVQRWLQKHFSSTAAMTNHSDSFTYNTVTIELINIFGSIICCCGIYRDIVPMLMVWFHLFSFACYGKTFFHILTCVEHYLAVVHPITYLSLRKESGIEMRNISIGCIWLVCLGGTGLITLGNCALIVDMCFLSSSLIIISFCSISVLCVLVRPGPGKQGRDQERVDPSKKRAFYTIVAILGVLSFRYGWDLVWTVQSVLDEDTNECFWITGAIWSSFPSSLVLPLLFLQRAGTLACCKNNTK